MFKLISTQINKMHALNYRKFTFQTVKTNHQNKLKIKKVEKL